MGAYAIYKVTNMIEFKEAIVQQQVQEYYFEDKDALVGGFQVAAAIISWGSASAPIEDPEIGELNFYLKHWQEDFYLRHWQEDDFYSSLF